MSEIERDGVRIHYEVHSGGPRTPVLMSHGFSATGVMHFRTVPALTASRTCITWDVRGHGASDYPVDPAAYTIPATIADMRAILDTEGIDRVILLGHSMGGFLSLSFQRALPERVRALILVGTGPGYRRDESRAAWNDLCETYAEAFEQQGLRALSGAEEVRAASHRNAGGLVLAARGILTQDDSDVLDHLADIDIPTLIVAGSEDRPFLPGMTYMASKIAGAQHVVIAGAGHAPMLTHPDEYNETIVGFLDLLEI